MQRSGLLLLHAKSFATAFSGQSSCVHFGCMPALQTHSPPSCAPATIALAPRRPRPDVPAPSSPPRRPSPAVPAPTSLPRRPRPGHLALPKVPPPTRCDLSGPCNAARSTVTSGPAAKSPWRPRPRGPCRPVFTPFRGHCHCSAPPAAPMPMPRRRFAPAAHRLIFAQPSVGDRRSLASWVERAGGERIKLVGEEARCVTLCNIVRNVGRHGTQPVPFKEVLGVRHNVLHPKHTCQRHTSKERQVIGGNLKCHAMRLYPNLVCEQRGIDATSFMRRITAKSSTMPPSMRTTSRTNPSCRWPLSPTNQI